MYCSLSWKDSKQAEVAADGFFVENTVQSNKGIESKPLRSIRDVLSNLDRLNLQDALPSMYLIYLLLRTLPVTSASAERSFSAMKLIKTRLRSKIGDEWMNDQLFLYMNRDLA